MNFIDRLLYEPTGGQFREYIGINAIFEPADLSLYQNLLTKPFASPEKPVVLAFTTDYLKVSPWPLSRYQEWSVLLKSTWDGNEGWYCVSMPVTKWLPMMGGRNLGFPKYIVDSITLVQRDQGWVAQSQYKGKIQLSMEFQPGITRQLAPWEHNLISKESFFAEEPAYLLVPPGKGPHAQRVRLNHVVTPQWAPQPGMVCIQVNPNEPWAGLVPAGGSFPGTFNHFKGGVNLVTE